MVNNLRRKQTVDEVKRKLASLRTSVAELESVVHLMESSGATSSVTCQTSKRLASQPVRLVARVKQKGEPDVTRPVINSCYSISIAGMSAMHSAARFGQRFASSP